MPRCFERGISDWTGSSCSTSLSLTSMKGAFLWAFLATINVPQDTFRSQTHMSRDGEVNDPDKKNGGI